MMSVAYQRLQAKDYYKTWSGDDSADVLPAPRKGGPSRVALRYSHMCLSPVARDWYTKLLRKKFALAIGITGSNRTVMIMENFTSTLRLSPGYIRLITYEMLMHTLPTACRMPKVSGKAVHLLLSGSRHGQAHLWGLLHCSPGF